MNHLVIGYGNMGRRHADILRAFGDQVDSVDLDWEPGKTDYKRYSSVIIATPPKTHINVILDAFTPPFGPTPAFIEKPVLTEIWRDFEHPDRLLSPITMVACNWRYCQCVDASQGFIEMGYPADPETAYLDMIHFLDLFWLNYGEPEFGGIGYVGPIVADGIKPNGLLKTSRKIEMTVSTESAMLSVVFDPGAEKPYMRHNGKAVHRKGVCSMFERQMRDWRECVRYGVHHLNSFRVAAERTNWLIERWTRNVLPEEQPLDAASL